MLLTTYTVHVKINTREEVINMTKMEKYLKNEEEVKSETMEQTRKESKRMQELLGKKELLNEDEEEELEDLMGEPSVWDFI